LSEYKKHLYTIRHRTLDRFRRIQPFHIIRL